MVRSAQAERDAMLVVVRRFRALETPFDSVPVLGDADAARVLAAWKKTDQHWHHPRAAAPEMDASNHGAVWAWLCAGWQIDERTIIRICGLPASVVQEKLDILRGNRLIYPDGSTSTAADIALEVFIASKVPKQPKEPKQPKTKKTDSDPESN